MLLSSSLTANPELDDDFADLPLEDEEELLDEAINKDGEDSESIGRARRDDGGRRDDGDAEGGRRRRRRGGHNRYRRSREDGDGSARPEPQQEWQGGERPSDDQGDPLLWDGDFPVVPELLTQPPANVSEEPKEAPLGRRRRGAGKVASASAEELVSQPDEAKTDGGKASSSAKGRGRKQAPKADEAVEAVEVSAESVEGETAVPAKAPPVSRDRAAARKKAAPESVAEPSTEPSSGQADVVEPKAVKPVISLVEKAEVAEKVETPKADAPRSPFGGGEKIEEVLVTSGDKRERRGWWQRLIENP